jgi:hypothetical protein
MEAARHMVKVQNHKTNVSLQDDFIADKVKVIILIKSNPLLFQL